MSDSPASKQPIVRYLDKTPALECPHGHVRRVITGGAGGVANVHVVSVTEGSPHVHSGYDEVYYVLAGKGRISLGAQGQPLRPGAAVVIPAGVPHALEAEAGQVLEFVIFGVPPVPIEDERARPRKPGG
ncbi:MAG: cupin domain-containing protein [Planctomycetota bacterium]|nr:cupin domain-containing protein [Planctomycetota bacterium]